jgi:hypothetical protein
MCCIQPMMHSCALFCIPEHYGGTIPETECVGMHRTVEPHILTQEKPSGLKAKLTCGRNGYGGWTGCGRAIRRAHGAPMCHYMSSKSSSDSSPSPNAYTCECKRMRVWMNAFECAWMRKNASASECNVSTECSLCGEAYKCIWMQLV